MDFIARVCGALLSYCRPAFIALLWTFGPAAQSQGFPPPALGTATSVEAAFMALGVAKPEPSTRLLLDLPDITVAGPVHARLASELPGTAAFVLLRGAPLPPPQPNAAAPAPQPAPSQPPTPVLIKAYKIPAGGAGSLQVDFDVAATQSYTLLAYAQGRWFTTTREIKVGMPSRGKASSPSAKAR